MISIVMLFSRRNSQLYSQKEIPSHWSVRIQLSTKFGTHACHLGIGTAVLHPIISIYELNQSLCRACIKKYLFSYPSNLFSFLYHSILNYVCPACNNLCSYIPCLHRYMNVNCEQNEENFQ